jgi:HEAT repeat protein
VLAGHLAGVGLYALLSPLERLFESEERQVRSAVVSALSRYFYKRTFVTLEKALRDPDREVVGEATAALDRLRFEHAFDPLARIYRTATRNEVRLAALKTLARIDVIEAAELLLASLEQGGPEERDAAIKALTAARGARFVEVARMAYPQATPRLRAAIDQVLRARGLAA